MCYQELSSQSDLRKAVENEKLTVSSIAVLLSHENVHLHIKTIQCEKFSVGSLNFVLHYIIYQLCLRIFVFEENTD